MRIGPSRRRAVLNEGFRQGFSSVCATSFRRRPFWPVLSVDVRTSCGVSSGMTPTKSSSPHDEVLKTLQMYIDGSKQGKSALMRPAFHPQASFFGYAGDQLAVGTEFLFDWIDRNGPAPDIEPRVMSVDVLESIAVVRVEIANWSGKLAGSGVRMSDLFTFLRMPEGWRIIQKAFHWNS